MNLLKILFWALIIVGISWFLAERCDFGDKKDTEGGSEPKHPVSRRVDPATRVRPEHWGVKVSIDGTNEYHKDKHGMGHDTTVVLEPGEEAAVHYIDGMLSYRSPHADSFKIKLAGPRSSGFSFERYDEVRYNLTGSANALLIILRTSSEKESVVMLGSNYCMKARNDFEEPAQILLFFNTVEFASFEGNEGVPESAYQYNGWFGQRAVFDVVLARTERLTQEPETDLCTPTY